MAKGFTVIFSIIVVLVWHFSFTPLAHAEEYYKETYDDSINFPLKRRQDIDRNYLLQSYLTDKGGKKKLSCCKGHSYQVSSDFGLWKCKSIDHEWHCHSNFEDNKDDPKRNSLSKTRDERMAKIWDVNCQDTGGQKCTI